MKKAGKDKIGTYPEKLVTARNPKSAVAEAYRAIRTNIEFSLFDKEVKTILFTSATQGEGKSVVSANIAVTMALGGKKTLIIDADLRNPTQHKIFNIGNNLGLTNMLINENLHPDEVIIAASTDNLFILPSGPLPPNPAELLNSQKMRGFIASLTNYSDIILVDAPPINVVTDAAILASYLDGTVLIAASGQVVKEQAAAAREQLNKVKANILGVVLNKTPANGSYSYNYYYGGDNS
ncbi:MAG: Tyrosine-protein kinase YwqD [Dehalococcoidia bacterium]|nr:Tyrosine-protein kinase YwqD [Bacillota bacterium]